MYYNLQNSFEEEQDELKICLLLKRDGDVDNELEIFNRMITKCCAIPYVYKRVAEIYMRNRKFEEAKNALIRWFETDHWKIPNMASSSLKMLDMLEKLEGK